MDYFNEESLNDGKSEIVPRITFIVVLNIFIKTEDPLCKSVLLIKFFEIVILGNDRIDYGVMKLSQLSTKIFVSESNEKILTVTEVIRQVNDLFNCFQILLRFVYFVLFLQLSQGERNVKC
jgi:hypothetical protein